MHEINLLPPDRRSTLRREVTVLSIQRFVNSMLLGVSILSGGLVVVAIILWTVSYRAAATTDAEFAATTDEYQGLRDEIAETNLFLTYVHSLAGQRIVWSDFLAAFFASVPPGVTIDSLSGRTVFKDGEFSETQFSLAGVAVARGTLTIFADRLRLLPGTVRLDAPNTNLIMRENPSYRFDLYLKGTADEEAGV